MSINKVITPMTELSDPPSYPLDICIVKCEILKTVRLRSHETVYGIRYSAFAIRYSLYVYTGMAVHIGSTCFKCVSLVSMKKVWIPQKKILLCFD